MTAFEAKGIELQETALTRSQAQSRFEYSCKLCCTRGLRLDCDSCAIKCAHEVVDDAFDYLNPNVGIRPQADLPEPKPVFDPSVEFAIGVFKMQTNLDVVNIAKTGFNTYMIKASDGCTYSLRN